MTSRYELLGHIARGGMAEVHLARTRSEGGFTKLLALKRILESYADSPQLTTMFMDEARLAARLSHPNIVQVFDFGKDEQGYFIAMEYVPGPDLASVLRTMRHSGERPPEAPMIDVVLQVLRGLEHAHRLTGVDGQSANVIHRDVSPGNVLLTPDGVAKLSDFGVARAAERLSENTRAGKTKGKAAYMSPEQARSRPLDARSDVFAAGLLLWEALAGQRCYVAADDATLIRMAAKGEVRKLKDVGIDLDPALAEILDKALQLEPDKRFASAASMAEALEAYHRQHFPKYTSAALGLVVQRALDQLPPLPHRALREVTAPEPAAAPEPQPEPQPEARPEPLPEQRESRPSVRRPRPELPQAESEPAKTRAEITSEPASQPAPKKESAVLSLMTYAAVTVAVAAAVLGGMAWYDHKRETEVPVYNGPPQPMQPLVAKPAEPAPKPVAPQPAPVEVRRQESGNAAPATPATGGTGYLSVKCDPWCDIHIDGKPAHQRSPAEKIPLAAGKHVLRLVNPTVHLEKHAVVVIRPNETLSRYFNLVLDR